MFAAIDTRFGGNAATKKTQKTLLKQQYENFSATSAESLDSIFIRLQKIVSMDKSKITRKQSKASKHGHEKPKIQSRSPKSQAEAKSLAISSFMKPQGPILQFPEVNYN
ncbi:hypothetical protein Tco_0741730, partial [Tanacetum coccineum]